MKVSVYNKQGKEQKTVDLPAEVFAVALKPDVVKQVIVAIQANQREVYAHTKGRSEVRGGGKKPWRQKGTGRARHGSTRSPIWVGGGVTFGPTKERNFSKKINKKVRRLALKMVLSDKAENKAIVVVEDLNMEAIKTKAVVDMLKALPLDGRPTLILTDAVSEALTKSVANIPKTDVILATDANAAVLAQYEKVLVSEAGLQKMIEVFA
ncbi:MAG: 50S ribosomal protein L4 [Patescibacteria group bacterium]